MRKPLHTNPALSPFYLPAAEEQPGFQFLVLFLFIWFFIHFIHSEPDVQEGGGDTWQGALTWHAGGPGGPLSARLSVQFPGNQCMK